MLYATRSVSYRGQKRVETEGGVFMALICKDMALVLAEHPLILFYLIKDVAYLVSIIQVISYQKFKLMQPKIKLSKHMPDVFLQSRPKDKQREQKNTQRHPTTNQKQKQKPVPTSQKIVVSRADPAKVQKDKQKQKQKGKSKRNRNPFINVRQYMKFSQAIYENIKEFRQEFDLDRFSHLSFEHNPDVIAFKEESKQNKIKLEDCLTLNEMRKNQSGCFKKILHVPSLTVYFMRESPIDFSIDKNDLELWVKKCNSQVNSSVKPQKIIQLYWNIPQGSYSIIYQYSDSVMLDQILQNTSIFPLPFIQNIALTHLKADLQIFNSILLIKRGQQSEIRYLAVYEQVDDIVPQYRTFRELMKINGGGEQDDARKIQKKMVARLGFLLLITFFCDAIVDQDIANILFQSKDCCLFHKQMNNSSSLMKAYIETSILLDSEKQVISDFFCKVLKFKPEQRATFSELSKHKFFRMKFGNQICKMNQVITMLQSTGPSTRDISIHKLNKLLSGMSLILQGSSENQRKQVDITPSNQNIKYVLSELGFTRTQIETKMNMNDVINKFKKVYHV